MDKNKVLNEFESLPQDAQQQVINFINSLQKRYKIDEENYQTNQREITEEKFLGIWKDRTDLKDSNAWVRKIRRSEWKNSS